MNNLLQREDANHNSGKINYWIPLGIFVCALFLRLIYIHQIYQNSPFFNSLISDSAYYYQWAQQLAAGNWWGNNAFFRSPLYPYFLAIIIKFYGNNLYIVRIIQAIIGSVSCVAIYLIGKKIFTPVVGIVAALLALFYGPFIFYDGCLLMAHLVLFFNLGMVFILSRTRDNSSFKNWLFAGVLLGLSILTRANALLFIPFLLLWIWITFKGESKKKLALNFITFCLGVGLIVLPITLRNYLLSKDFVLVASSGGINFYIGNNTASQGMYVSVKDTGIAVDNSINTNVGMEAESRRFAEKKVARYCLLLRSHVFGIIWGSILFKKIPSLM